MAHHVGSQSSGFPSAQSRLLRAPLSASEAPLDLNLSQKVSQNFLKGHEETDPSDSQAKSLEALGSSQPKSGLAPDVSRSNTNGFVDPRNNDEQHHVQISLARQKLNNSVSGATPIEPPQSSLASNDSGGVNQVTPVSVLGKQKFARVEVAGKLQKEFCQSGTAALDDGSSQRTETAQLSPGQKRKSPRIKQQTPDVTKKVILALEANEDEGPPRSRGRPRGSSLILRGADLYTPRSRSRSSSAASDPSSGLAERRLLLEERKVRLAEQRFALEEKKLEATIEIGKGLIVSMERMTNTISGFGAPFNHHR